MIENRSSVYAPYISPFSPTKIREAAYVAGKTLSVSRGPSECGYDISLGYPVVVRAGYSVLAVSKEKIYMPMHMAADVVGKSTWTRLGISLNTTKIDPGFAGHVTIEITWTPLWAGLWRHLKGLLVPSSLHLPQGIGLGTLVFTSVAQATSYDGKYQQQGALPQGAR